MLVALRGVRADGSPRAASVPNDPRPTLRLVRGAAVTLQLDATTPAGVPVAGVGMGARLTIRLGPGGDAGKLLQFDLVPPVPPKPGRYTAALAAGATARLQAGNYFYDVWLTQAGVTTEPLIGVAPCVLADTPGAKP